MLRTIYGANCAFPTLDLEDFVRRSLDLHDRREILSTTDFVSRICHRFADMERTPDNLLQAYNLEFDRWARVYKAKPEIVRLIQENSQHLPTHLLDRFFSFDRQQQEERRILLLRELQRRIGRLLTPVESPPAPEVQQVAAS